MKDTSPTLGRKLALILGALAVVWLGFGLLAAVRLRGAGASTSGAAARDAELMLIVPRMGDVLQDAGRWFAQRVHATAPEEVAALDRDLAMVRGRMWFETGRLRSGVPEFGAPLADVERAFQDLVVVGERARDAARARQSDRARAMMQSEFRPRFERLRVYLPTLAEAVGKQRVLEARSREEARVRAVTGALLWLAIPSILALAGACLAVWKFAGQPFSALASCAKAMVDGDLAVAIPGGNRRDEIGKMAGALSKLRHGQLRQKKMEEEIQELSERIKAGEAVENARILEAQRTREELGRLKEAEASARAEGASARASEAAAILEQQVFRAELERARGEWLARQAEQEAVAGRLREELERTKAALADGAREAEAEQARGREAAEKWKAELQAAHATAAASAVRAEEERRRREERTQAATEAEARAAKHDEEAEALRQELALAREEIAAVAAARASESGRWEKEVNRWQVEAEAARAARTSEKQQSEAAASQARIERAESEGTLRAELERLREDLGKAREEAGALEQMYTEEIRRLEDALAQAQARAQARTPAEPEAAPAPGPVEVEVKVESPAPPPEPAATAESPVRTELVADMVPVVPVVPGGEPEGMPVAPEPEAPAFASSPLPGELESWEPSEPARDIAGEAGETAEPGGVPFVASAEVPAAGEVPAETVAPGAAGEPAVAAASEAAPGPVPGGEPGSPEEVTVKPKPARRKRAPKESPQLSLLTSEPAPDPDDEMRRLIEAGRLPGVDLEEATSRLGESRERVEDLLLESLPGQRRLLTNLRRALEDEDREEARRNAAALAGEAGHWGEPELRRLAKTVELAIKFHQDNLEPMVAELEREAGRVFGGLEHLSRRRGAAPAGDAPAGASGPGAGPS